jgi:NitT/TauT family transport system permease protein
MFITLGPGFSSRVLFVSIAVVAIMFINTAAGIRTLEPDLIRMMELLGASRSQIARKLMLRHTLSFIVVGVTFAAPYALMLAIAVEMLFAAATGLGGMLFHSQETFDPAGVLAALGVSTAIGIVLTELSARIGARFSPRSA